MRRVLVFVALAACKSPDSNPAAAIASSPATATAAPPASPVACPKPTILVDGAPMKVGSALAARFSGSDAYQLTLSTRAVTCDEILTGAVAVNRDEVSFNVGYGSEPFQRRVDFDNTSAQPAMELVAAPGQAGSEMSVCVRERVRLTGKLPISNDPPKTIELEGLVRAKYCGTLK